MAQENFHFIQFLPYPSNCLIKALNYTPVWLYRLGLGKLFGNYILILSTTGRDTGETYRTPLEYLYHEEKYYILSSFGDRPDWFKNIKANPQVTIQNGYDTICATARAPQSDDEWEAIRLYLTQSPIGKLLMSRIDENLRGADLAEKVRQWPALALDPSDAPCPPPLESDLVWAWPILLLGAAIDITLLWLMSRKK
jgi:deazaflavin-dependent oxidoreductase (nitroreductase family)